MEFVLSCVAPHPTHLSAEADVWAFRGQGYFVTAMLELQPRVII